LLPSTPERGKGFNALGSNDFGFRRPLVEPSECALFALLVESKNEDFFFLPLREDLNNPESNPIGSPFVVV
jgi:hypothetical protein